MEKLYKLEKSAKSRLGAECGSDHELLIAKFRLKLKKVGETTRPFRYDLNQIPYDYTVEGTNRFKGLDLVDNVPEELWTEVCGGSDQNHPQEKEMQKGKMVVWGGLTNSWEKKRSETQTRKRYTHLNAEFRLRQSLWLCGSQQTLENSQRWKYQTTWPTSWEICMQVRKQQLELDMEQQSSSKLGKEYHQGCI